VNEAVRTLKDPIKRAEALLRRRGVPLGETSEPPSSPAFLMNVMQWREALSEARKSGDVQRVERLCDEVRQEQQRVEQALVQGLSETAAGSAGPASLVALLGELRYYRRFFDEAGAVIDDLS
jgi:molecular chaperone HscB